MVNRHPEWHHFEETEEELILQYHRRQTETVRQIDIALSLGIRSWIYEIQRKVSIRQQ